MTTAERYIYQVYKEESFSKAASSLFISQPSLSAAVAHKEQELGFRIFDRSTKPITLTPRGQIFMEMLEEIAESEHNMNLRLQALEGGKQNSIAIGGSSFLAYCLMTSVCGCFYRRHPDVEVKLDIGNFGAKSSLSERFTLNQKLDRGELDAVFCYEYDTEHYAGHKLYGERLIVAMHKNHVTPALRPYVLTREELLGGKIPTKKEITAPNAFDGIPFLDFAKNGSTGHRMAELLGSYTPSLHKVTNAVHSVVHYHMMCAGVGALLTGDCIVALSEVHEGDIVYFAFPKEISTRNIYLITQKDAHLSPNTKRFIQIARELCASSAPLSLYRE